MIRTFLLETTQMACSGEFFPLSPPNARYAPDGIVFFRSTNKKTRESQSHSIACITMPLGSVLRGDEDVQHSCAGDPATVADRTMHDQTRHVTERTMQSTPRSNGHTPIQRTHPDPTDELRFRRSGSCAPISTRSQSSVHSSGGEQRGAPAEADRGGADKQS